MAARRLRKELNDMNQLETSNCCAWPISGDLMLWEATILGVRDTPYYLGVFSLRLKFNKNYPFSAPRVNFKTKIYHCNIDFDGYICWDLLTTKWTALLTVSAILNGICALMRQPNADDPCDEIMAALYRDNPQQYNDNAIGWTLRYAIAPSVTLPPLLLQCQPVMLEELVQLQHVDENDDDEDDEDDDDGDDDDEDENENEENEDGQDDEDDDNEQDVNEIEEQELELEIQLNEITGITTNALTV